MPSKDDGRSQFVTALRETTSGTDLKKNMAKMCIVFISTKYYHKSELSHFRETMAAMTTDKAFIQKGREFTVLVAKVCSQYILLISRFILAR